MDDGRLFTEGVAALAGVKARTVTGWLSEARRRDSRPDDVPAPTGSTRRIVPVSGPKGSTRTIANSPYWEGAERAAVEVWAAAKRAALAGDHRLASQILNSN